MATRELLPASADLPDDFVLSSGDVTEEGMAFVRKHYERWLKFVDRGGAIEDQRHLEQALARMRSPAGGTNRDRGRAPAKKAGASGQVAGGAAPASAAARSTAGKRQPRAPGPAQVYDKAKWHLEGTFPPDVPEENAYVPFGYVLGWLVQRDLISEELRTSFADDLGAFRQRALTGPQLYARMGGVLSSDEVAESARPFLTDYLDPERSPYLREDHPKLCPGRKTDYHVPDDWALQDQVCDLIDRRYRAWKQGGVAAGATSGPSD